MIWTFLFIYILFLSFVPFCIWEIHKNVIGNEQLLSIKDSNYIKGMAACGVFLAHCYFYIENNSDLYITPLKFFSFLGGMGVLMFLFVGGFGLTKSCFETEEFDKTNYWIRRLRNVYIPAICIETMFQSILMITQEKTDFGSFFKSCFFGAWYIDVVMLEYLAFYLSMIICKSAKRRVFFVFIFNILLFFIFSYLNLNSRWRNGLFLYPFGVWAAYNEKMIKGIVKKYYNFVLYNSIFCFCAVGAIFALNKGSLFSDLIKNMAGIFLAICFMTFFSRYEIKNRLMIELGKRSLFIYLVHLGVQSCLEIVKKYVSINICSYVFWWLLTTAILTEFFYQFFERKIKKNRGAEKSNEKKD